MSIKLSEVLPILVAYAGPLDDPRIGWVGHMASSPDVFKCERCAQEHPDCTQIPHLEDCSAAALLRLLNHIAKEPS